MNALIPNRFVLRVLHKGAFALAMALCALWSAATAFTTPPAAPTQQTAAEWPRTWDGALLRPLALSDVEQRFADRFPGAIARLTDGQQVLVLRQVNQPTRMLHPAADCYRALGYRIAAQRLEHDAQQRLWRCFTAERSGARPLRVCERIEDARGQGFTDTSAWYWAAVAAKSQGPWQAVTTARAL